MPLPISLAHRIARRLAEVRKTRTLPYLRPDGKVQVTVGYDNGAPTAVECVVISAQHHEEVEAEQLRTDVREQVIAPVLEGVVPGADARLHINPTGRFVIGGPVADSGLTGRKQMVDSYGAWARHGGGCFSGKDPTKIDRAGAYGARYVAKNIVAAGLAARCEVEVAYAIGVVKPVAIRIDTQGTGKVPDAVDRAVPRRGDAEDRSELHRMGEAVRDVAHGRSVLRDESSRARGRRIGAGYMARAARRHECR